MTCARPFALALIAGALALPGAAMAQKAKATAKTTAAANAAMVEQGRKVFTHNCAPCHGRGPGDDGSPQLPGTSRLEARYKGSVPAALELRSDLTGDALRLFVRNGIGAMPSFRKVEVSDSDLDAIAAFMKSNAARGRAK